MKDKDGFISKEELGNACKLSGYSIAQDFLDALFIDCDENKDGKISFLEFCNFLCYKDSMKLEGKESVVKKDSQPTMPTKEIKNSEGLVLLDNSDMSNKNKVPDGPLVPRTLSHQIDKKVGGWKTTYDVINEAPFRAEPMKKRVYGIASIRNDLIAPEFRKIQDKTNYGNDGSAWSLLTPSIFAQRGIYERDVLRGRPKLEMQTIFKNIGVDLSPSDFERVWNRASSKNPYGEVSVEEFRNALDELNEADFAASDSKQQEEEVECLNQKQEEAENKGEEKISEE